MNTIRCLSFNNPDRKNRMKERFERENINYKFYDGIPHENAIRSAFLGHLYMIRDFLLTDSESKYGIFCEDDILLRVGLNNLLNEILQKNYDTILLGYLIDYNPCKKSKMIRNITGETIKEINYLNVFEFLWGMQMYALNRDTCRYYVDKFCDPKVNEFKLLDIYEDKELNPDSIITKEGKINKYVYPMLAVEEGSFGIHNDEFHKKCFRKNYKKDLYF